MNRSDDIFIFCLGGLFGFGVVMVYLHFFPNVVCGG